MSDIKSTFMNITKSLSKTSGDIVKNTKLNMELANAEDQLKALYMEIGKKVHEIYAYGGSLGEFFDQKYAELLDAQKNVDNIRLQIEQIKGVRACPNCGKNADKKAEFCPTCGYRMDEERKAAPEGEAPPETGAEGGSVQAQESSNADGRIKICGACGGSNEAVSKFCLYCGRTLS